MHRVVPELIVENYRAGNSRGEFDSVGMFLDLSGFSTMTDVLMQHGQHGAEVLAGLMHKVFDPLVESVLDHKGKIVGFAGDGIMALFPVEEDVHSTALYALTSAYVIQKRLEENPLHQTVYGRFAISAKIGLSVGTTSWRILHSSAGDQATYYFRGSAVDEAAEAEHHAKSGDILLTERLRQILAGDIKTVPFGPFHRLDRFCIEMPDPTRVVFPPVDLSISRLFMPEEVIVYDVPGEFRQVVNLFMRFPDLPEEQLLDLTGKVFDLRNKYGGLLSRLDFGDKGCNMLVLWGAPTTYENDINRAMNFLLDLKSQVDFPITTGVTYYIAHAGYLGSVMCEDYTCYGWGVNLASRFMMNAASGETWVDDRIARRVSRRFETEFIGSQLFKGFSSEQKVHRLRGHKEIVEPIYQGEAVGREEELAQLTTFTEPLWQNKFAGVLLICGDAGIGKGRLVYEFRSSKTLEDKKLLWALCQSDQILRHSFNPLHSWLTQYFGITAHRSPLECKQAFDRKLDDLRDSIPDSELAAELDRTRSFLGALLDLHWADSLYEQLDAQGRYNNTLLALIALLKAESLRQPVLFLLEDLQFTDHDTRDFLRHLKRALVAAGSNHPIGMILTSRPVGDILPNDLVDTRLDLGGLTSLALARFVENMLGGPAAPELVALLMGRSEGNPYFAEQILRYLQDENALETSKTGWSVSKKVRADFLPGDIRSILVARLDQLTRRVKEIIQTASVLGREFEIQVLLQMLLEDENILWCVAEAEQAAIWTPLSSMRYIFSHALLRDAAYEMQMEARRQELHALAVEALEKLFEDSLKPHYAELAYHAEHAGLRSRAQNYYRLAARASTDLYQNSQGIHYYTSALAYTPDDDLAEQFALLFERAELFNRLGERASQRNDLEALANLARQLDDQQRMAQVDVLFAHYYISVGDYPAVIEYAESAMDLNRMVEDPGIALDTYRIWPLALLRQGKFDSAMSVAQEGRQLSQIYGEPVKEGYILNSMGLIAIEQKDPAVAHGYLEQALGIARATGDRRLESITLGNLGNFAGYVRQDYGVARQYFEQGYTIFHERGERSAEAVSLSNLGWVAGRQGDTTAARSYLERALLLAMEVGNVYLEINTLVNLSATTGMEDNPQISFNYAQMGLELSRRTGDRSGEAWSLFYLGHAHLMLKNLQEAEASFRESMLIREELGQSGMKLEPLAGLIQTLLAKSELTKAQLEAEQIIPLLEAGDMLGGTEEPLRVYYAVYSVLEKAQDAHAQTVLMCGVRLLEAQVAKLREDAARRMYIENVPWRFAIWKAGQAISA